MRDKTVAATCVLIDYAVVDVVLLWIYEHRFSRRKIESNQNDTTVRKSSIIRPWRSIRVIKTSRVRYERLPYAHSKTSVWSEFGLGRLPPGPDGHKTEIVRIMENYKTFFKTVYSITLMNVSEYCFPIRPRKRPLKNRRGGGRALFISSLSLPLSLSFFCLKLSAAFRLIDL